MPDNRLLVTLLLRAAHYEVAEAENGRLALAKIDAQDPASPFDLIVMDMQMPVMDGYAATRQLRDRGLRLPVIALTAHAMASDRERCLAAGCDDYQTKPVDPARFLAAVARFLPRTQASAPAARVPGAAA
jgi:CheY-like chemotaxis protein